MNTITKDFIERHPKIKIQPEAEYTCTQCYYHGRVDEAHVAGFQPFSDRLTIICNGCQRSVTLIYTGDKPADYQ